MPKLPENPPLLCEVWDAHGFVGYYGGPDNLPYPERSKAFKIFWGFMYTIGTVGTVFILSFAFAIICGYSQTG